jgi:hypothetical protein
VSVSVFVCVCVYVMSIHRGILDLALSARGICCSLLLKLQIIEFVAQHLECQLLVMQL